MLDHDTIWSAIDRLAGMFGYSASGLAKQAGLDPTTFNKSKRIGPDGKPRWPSTESIACILAATGANMTDFMELLDEDGKESTPPVLPLLGFAQAGSAGYFDEDGYPAGKGWDEIPFPELEKKKDVHSYALEISGDSMEPVYRDGDVLVVSPGVSLRRGDRVVVKTHKGEVMAKELVRQTATRLELKSLNPDHEDRSFARDEISWIARIVWVSQ